MPRNYSFTNGSIYHVYNRGVRKVKIYNNTSDYIRWENLLAWCLNYDYPYTSYLNRLNKLKSPTKQAAFRKMIESSHKYIQPLVEILTYVEMPNHFHLVIEQMVDNGVSKFMQKLATAYSMYINRKYDLSGAVFEGSYKTVPVISDPQLNQLLIYALRNPIEAGLATNETIIQYKWSATKEYLNEKERKIISMRRLPDYFSDQVRLLETISESESGLGPDFLQELAIDS